MELLILLIVLMVLFGGGGLTYSRWGTGGPAWGGTILWILFVVVIVALVLNLLGVLTYPSVVVR